MIKQGDCLELMKEIPDGSVDMILQDPHSGRGIARSMCGCLSSQYGKNLKE